jgi:hypothetical protein
LDDALMKKPIVLIPSSFTVSDADYNQTRVIVGEETQDEAFEEGQAATRAPKIHNLNYKSGKLILIDTPVILNCLLL